MSMTKKEVFISRKATYISMNISLILSFIFFFLLIGNTPYAKTYSFAGVISEFAKTSETGIFATTINANNERELEEITNFNGANLNNPDIYKNSVIGVPNEKNRLELSFEAEIIEPVTFTLQTLWTYPSERVGGDGAERLGSDDLFAIRTPKVAEPGTKSIMVSKSVAEKIAKSSGETDLFSTLGKTTVLNYLDFELNPVSAPSFIKGIILDDEGIMPTYEIHYGKDLIFLAANAHDYKIADSRLDIYYTQSIYRNYLHTDALTKEFGPERFSFSNNDFLSDAQKKELNEGYTFIFNKGNSFKDPLFITFLVLFVLIGFITAGLIVLYFHPRRSSSRKSKAISILPFLISLLLFYVVTTILHFALSNNILSGFYLGAPRGMTPMVFAIIGAIIIFLKFEKKGVESDEKNSL